MRKSDLYNFLFGFFLGVVCTLFWIYTFNTIIGYIKGV